ncbi:phosphomannomutase [Phtheirospermum japonicum]|uniref:Phosphomannomutase n=1 Tax=Phtheirospermum japonicum TaxID=374723 RepID=A0A830BII9_9LAMI|nr:phosphomannomutase [Phtheirospermum japonicum]
MPVATTKMLEFMQELKKVVTVGVVGGSDLVKISEQLGITVFNDYDYVFAEKVLVAYKGGNLIGTQSFKSYLGEDKLKEFINFTLHYIADLDIPIKRRMFIEFRNGMLNVCPIGRNCSQEERDEFEDKVHNIRSKIVFVLRERINNLGRHAQAGLVDEGRGYIKLLLECGMRPTIQHYGCMVDSFGKAGLVGEAYEVLVQCRLRRTW